jgi:hypothetical protein
VSAGAAARTPDAESPAGLVIEVAARRTLQVGAGVLALGIAMVGVGADKEGATPVLAGLLLTILGIHTYGRLGPEGEPADDPSATAAWVGVWRGGLVAAAGAAVVAGGSPEGTAALVAYAAILGGVIALASGLRGVRSGNDARRRAPAATKRAGGAARKGSPLRVEKRRRMDKSPPP